MNSSKSQVIGLILSISALPLPIPFPHLYPETYMYYYFALLTKLILSRLKGYKMLQFRLTKVRQHMWIQETVSYEALYLSERKLVLSFIEWIYEKSWVLFYNNFRLSWLEIKYSSFKGIFYLNFYKLRPCFY